MNSRLITANHLLVTGEGGNTIIATDHLQIDRGFTAIIGPSGSGKTTLLNSICGIKNVTTGIVEHYDEDGTVVFTHCPESRNQKLASSVLIRTALEKKVNPYRSHQTGYIPQSPFLDPLLTPTEQLTTQHTIRGNVLDKDYVTHLADTLGIADIFKPQAARRVQQSRVLQLLGINRPKERLCSVLSGGEKQRLAVIIALAHRPNIIFADEPASALDTTHKGPLYDLLRATADDGNSVVVVSHDEGVGQYADNIVHVEDGRVIS